MPSKEIEVILSPEPSGALTVGQLKQMLKKVPDYFVVHVLDVNYDDSYREVGQEDIQVDAKRKRLYLPGTGQLYLD